MTKAVLLSLILVLCTCVGRMLSNGRKRRMELLGDILAAMRVLRLRILNSMEPVGVLLRKSELFLFRELGNGLWEGESLNECWIKMRDSFTKRGQPLDCMTHEDISLLDTFFSSLGKSGREEQNDLFAVSIAQLEDTLRQARSHYADCAKLYTALGALVGVGICVIIV